MTNALNEGFQSAFLGGANRSAGLRPDADIDPRPRQPRPHRARRAYAGAAREGLAVGRLRDVECSDRRAEAVGQHVPHGGRRGQHPCSVWEPVAVERKAQSALPQHHSRCPVARVALRFHTADPALVSRCARVDLDYEEPSRTSSSFGPAPGSGNRRSRANREGGRASPAVSAAMPPPTPRAPAAPREAGAESHHLAVAEASPVSPVLERVGAPHDAGVDRRHHERAEPGAEVLEYSAPRRSASLPSSGSASRSGDRA